jgi:hypothetical protein
MPAPTRKDVPGLTRRDEMAVSGAAMSKAPWAVAGAAGVIVTGGDLVLHLLTAHLAVTSSLSAGAVAFFAVAGGGVARSDAPGRHLLGALAWRDCLRLDRRGGLHREHPPADHLTTRFPPPASLAASQAGMLVRADLLVRRKAR